MIQISFVAIMGAKTVLEDLAEKARIEVARLGPACVAGREQRAGLVTLLETVEDTFRKIELTLTVQLLIQLKEKLKRDDYDCPYLIINSEVVNIAKNVIVELNEKKFNFIPTDKVKYFNKQNQHALFGSYVSLHFSDAANDIRDAGNSLAIDLWDSAAFYLMRVVEVGLRALAKKLRISFPKTPLDHAGWKAIVKAIDDKLSAKMPKSRGKKQSAALKFQHDTLVDFRAFEVARNEIMHGRSRYNEQDAIGMYNRVRDFMIRLANEI
jgi:hypothetical protein